MLLRAFAVSLVLAGCASHADAPRLGRAGPRLSRSAQVRDVKPNCEAERAALMSLPALAGTPLLERAPALARAKGEPVVFVRAPEFDDSASAVVRAYRRTLENSRFPWDLLDHLRPRFRANPKLGREVLLREGYLYADRADLAWALWDKVELEHLFSEPKLWIERGGARLHAARTDGKYRYLDGPDAGEAARLLLFDRVGVEGSEPSAPLHRDLRTLAHELGFQRARITRRTARGMLAELRYGHVWVPSVLSSSGAKLRLVCESIPQGEAAHLATQKRRALARERVLAALRSEMLAQIRAEVPFDEPHTEWGQQDGHLRGKWLAAYSRGDDFYYFNHDRYPVFDARGDARPPQVCVDFITETFERACGTYYRPRGEPRGRVIGRLDFDDLIQGNRRQVPEFLGTVRAHPEMFEIDTVPERERLPYVFKHRFYRRIERDADQYPAGSIVVIRGFAPWDHYNEPHYHSFFVYETDPITGMPILLIGNAGKPRLQSWEPVMSRTPQRQIEQVIRPRLDWLTTVISVGDAAPRVPPLLAVN